MKALLANIQHAIRNNESVNIGGGTFEASDLQKIVALYGAATKAQNALMFDYGGEPLPSLEKEALEALKLVLEGAQNA